MKAMLMATLLMIGSNALASVDYMNDPKMNPNSAAAKAADKECPYLTGGKLQRSGRALEGEAKVRVVRGSQGSTTAE